MSHCTLHLFEANQGSFGYYVFLLVIVVNCRMTRISSILFKLLNLVSHLQTLVKDIWSSLEVSQCSLYIFGDPPYIGHFSSTFSAFSQHIVKAFEYI